MGDSRHKDKDQDTLRARARERMDKGQLPRAKAARTWGGRGSGLQCVLCDLPILETDPEMELEFEGAAATLSLRLHLRCHSIWDSERRVPLRGVWTPVEKTLPPFDVSVEARLSMGAGRMVILNVMRVKSGRFGELLWINTTTGASLPAAWNPIEWRFPAGYEPVEPVTDSSAPKRA